MKDDKTAVALLQDGHRQTASLHPLDATPLSVAELEAEAERAARAIRVAATPTATWTAYAHVLRYWCAWARLRLGRTLALPTPVAVVKLFVLDHFGEAVRAPDGALTIRPGMPPAIDAALVTAKFKAQLGRLKMSTIDHRIAVLSWAHKEKRLDSPCQDAAVRQLLAACRKLAREFGEAPKQKSAATVDALDAMLATCDDTLEGLRDRALLLFGWASGGRRRSEIAQATVGDLEWLDARSAVFRMRRSKTGDAGPKPVVGEAADALRTWLTAANIYEGALFRRIWRNARIGEALSAHAIGHIVKRRAQAANLPGDFAGHSLRRGFITEAGRQKTPLAETMALSGHRVVKSVLRYHETGDVLASEAADVLSSSRGRRANRSRNSASHEAKEE